MEDHSIFYDNENQVVDLAFTRNYLESDVLHLFGQMEKLLEDKPYKQVVWSIGKSQKVENRRTRDLSSQQLKIGSISEIAFVGGNAANRILAKIFLKTGGFKTNGDFFKTKEDAIKWLKSKR